GCNFFSFKYKQALLQVPGFFNILRKVQFFGFFLLIIPLIKMYIYIHREAVKQK
ncbi:hypothetical protein HMPREF3033_01402, partial [Veillonellaceae bacterium DNF00751]